MTLAIYWMRRDLRWDDNNALFQALDNHKRVLPVFIFDRNILDKLEDRSDARVSFIHRRLAELRACINNRMWIYYGTPIEAFKQLSAAHQISAVYANEDYEPYAVQRDGEMADFLSSQGVRLHLFKDQAIFAKDEVATQKGDPYSVFTPYKKRWLSLLEPVHFSEFPSQDHLDRLNDAVHPMISLADMNFRETHVEMPESDYRPEVMAKYDQLRDKPAIEGTSRLGIHLRFGTISIRKLAREAKDLNETWLSQLIWRDFYFQILHHHPRVVNRAFREKYDAIQWRDDQADFERWCEGKTGYPIVDAGMRQLNQTGYMHNRVRMIVASFLCKHLLLDWRWGERYFAAKLLDFELAANNGNWQWAAGTGCDAAPYFRVFNPWRQSEKFDPDNAYIRRWAPEFGTKEYPDPMVPHDFARKRAIQVYKAGLDPEAADQNQKSLFD